jgi:hypothetical protein
MDSTFWTAQWAAISAAPVPVIALMVLAAIVFWWIKHVIDKRKIDGLIEEASRLRGEINTLRVETNTLKNDIITMKQRFALVRDKELAATRAAQSLENELRDMRTQIQSKSALETLVHTNSNAISAVEILRVLQGETSTALSADVLLGKPGAPIP